MLTYYLENKKDKPIYEYLYECIKHDIITQKLRPNEKLPSKRNFSKHLKVSVITIQNAYNQLLIEGYIYSQEKKGYFVSDVNYNIAKTAPSLKKIVKAKKQDQYLIDLKTNSIALDNFPFSLFAKITRQILTNQNSLLLTKTPNQGLDILQEALANHLYKNKGIEVAKEQIIIGAGSEYLYNILILLLGSNKKYALEKPSHISISKIYELNQLNYEYIELDEQGIKIEELEKIKANVIHVNCSHHYPTGITMPIQRRMELINYAQKNSAYIIEDDYDSEFRMDGKPINSLFQLDNKNVIYLNTFSKTLAPSFRISYMILPEKLLAIYQNKLGFLANSVSALEQIILAEFINQNYFEKHLNKMRNIYKTIRNELIDQLLSSPLKDHIKILEANAGLHFILKHDLDILDKTLLQKAKNLKINISLLSNYYQEANNSKALIINYSMLKKEDIPLTVRLLVQLLIN